MQTNNYANIMFPVCLYENSQLLNLVHMIIDKVTMQNIF